MTTALRFISQNHLLARNIATTHFGPLEQAGEVEHVSVNLVPCIYFYSKHSQVEITDSRIFSGLGFICYQNMIH